MPLSPWGSQTLLFRVSFFYKRCLVIIICYLSLTAYAFAELIDNALSATANNDGPRHIELRLVST